MQNLENKGVILPLRARSLGLKDLHAKSREHETYGRTRLVLRPNLELARVRRSERRLEATAISWVRLSKIDDYLVDNVRCNRLSDLGHAVNDKGRCGTGSSGNSPGGSVPQPRLGSKEPMS